MFIAGVGGTGVVTIGQLLGMAAHIEGRGCSVLDMAGLAQKGGAVYSHVVLAAAPDQLMNTRVAMGEADLVLAGDLVVATSADAMARLSPGRTRVLLNNDTAPTAAFVKNPDWTLPGAALASELEGVCGKEHVDTVDAAALAVALLGDAIYANPLMMGYAYQKGWLPLSRESLLRAIELNGQQVAANQAAFAWGRRAAQDLAGLNRLVAQGPKPASVYPEGIVELRRPRAAAPVAELKKPAGELEQLVSVRREFLTRYQDAAYAARYADLVDKVAHAEREATGTAAGAGGGALCLQADGLQGRVRSGATVLRWRVRASRGAAVRRRLEAALSSGAAAVRAARPDGKPVKRAYGGHPAPVPPAGAAAARAARASIRSATPPSGAERELVGNTTRR